MSNTERNIIETRERATIYTQGDLGGAYRKTEVRDLTIEVVKYAQYDGALRVTFTPKGARRARQLTLTYKPALLVLDGWNGPDMDDGYEKVDEICSRARHLSCSDSWDDEARQALTGSEIVFDAAGWNSYRGHHLSR